MNESGTCRIALVDAAALEPAYRTVSQRFPHIELTHIDSESPVDGFDGVVIHTDLESRADVTLRTARAGKHLLVESPIAKSSERARELIDAGHEYRVVLMAGHSARHEPSQVAIKKALSEGKLGDPGLLRIHLWRDSKVRDTYTSRELIGGLDLAGWFFEALPNTIYAVSADGLLQVHLGFEGGGMALIDYYSSLPEGGSYKSVSLIGSKGAAYADDHHNRNLLYVDGEPRAVNTGEGDFHLINQLSDFTDVVARAKELAAVGESGLQALLIAEAAQASVESGASMVLAGDSYEHA